MGKNNDPLARAEEVGQQVFEAVASGLTEVVGKLQALAEQIEQKVEEQLRTSAGNPPPAGPTGKTGKAGKQGKAGKAAKDAKDAKSGTPKAKKAIEAPVSEISAKKSAGKKTAAKKSDSSKKSAKSASAKEKSAGKKSTKKSSSKTSGSKSSASKGASGPTRDELYKQAQKLNIAGRSGMTKAQLVAAIKKATK